MKNLWLLLLVCFAFRSDADLLPRHEKTKPYLLEHPDYRVFYERGVVTVTDQLEKTEWDQPRNHRGSIIPFYSFPQDEYIVPGPDFISVSKDRKQVLLQLPYPAGFHTLIFAQSNVLKRVESKEISTLVNDGLYSIAGNPLVRPIDTGERIFSTLVSLDESYVWSTRIRRWARVFANGDVNYKLNPNLRVEADARLLEACTNSFSQALLEYAPSTNKCLPAKDAVVIYSSFLNRPFTEVKLTDYVKPQITTRRWDRIDLDCKMLNWMTQISKQVIRNVTNLVELNPSLHSISLELPDVRLGKEVRVVMLRNGQPFLDTIVRSDHVFALKHDRLQSDPLQITGTNFPEGEYLVRLLTGNREYTQTCKAMIQR